jgi:lactoylglutathione lyase
VWFVLSVVKFFIGEIMITGLGHLAVRAKDLEASAKFYREVVGLQEAFRMDRPHGTGVGTIYFYIAPSQFIELFPDGSGDQPENNTVGLKHICIEVDNAAAFQEEFHARGGIIDVPLKTGYSKCVQFWTHDPDGTKIEFMELPPESLQQQANQRFKNI